MKALFSWFIGILLVIAGFAQTPSPAGEPRNVLILGGIAHLGNGEKMENVALSLKNGYIDFIKYQMGSRIDRSEYDTVIQLENEHIYPGFIATNTTLGLREIDAVRASLDYDDVGEYNPHVRSAIAYNTESRITPTIRFNGVLLAQVTPRGGIISGSSSIMELDGWNWEDALHTEDEGIHLNWPSQFKGGGWWAEPKPLDKNDKADERIRSIYDFFETSKAYAQDSTPQPVNLRLKAMRGLFSGNKTLYVHANRAQELMQVARFKQHFNLSNVVVVGGYDAYLVPEVLKDQKIGVILRRLHSLPVRPEDPVDLPYRIPKMLQDTGILFCLDMGTGDMEVMNQRNLPFLAGTAVAYGLEYEDAVAAISGNSAKLLGISDRVGTLENGMEATLFISKGDALDMRTNDVLVAFIQGKQIALSNPQLDLYRKYKAKYPE
jgi:hypothetical protein